MKQFLDKTRQILALVLPYGKLKLLLILLLTVVQGFLQVIGVTSILPFLALAANPTGFLKSSLGQQIVAIWPNLTEEQMLLAAGIFAIAMLAASNAVLLFGEVARTRYVQGLGHWLRNILLGRILGNPYHYFLNHNTGDLLKKTSGDVMSFINGMLAPLMDFIARFFTVSLLVVTLFIINPGLTLAAGFGIGGFYVLAYKLLARLRFITSEGMKVANRGAMRSAIQALSGIKPIKIHNAELSFIKVYGKHSADQARLSKWSPIISNAPRYLIEPLAFGGIVGVVLYYVGTDKELQSILPSLGVMALAGYRMLPNLQLMYGALSGISLSSHALEEVQEELADPTSPDDAGPFVEKSLIKPLRWTDCIELRDIRFSYQASPKAVLDGINLTIPRNKFYAVIGETGSGKSTLIDLILGLHWPVDGGVFVDGTQLTRDRLRSWRAGIGYVPQEIFLTDDTIEANIAFGVEPEEIDYDRVREVARAAQLAKLVEEEMPNGYKTMTGERGVRLSGGQRQRIGLARALYHNPSLLVLDEATSALDNQTEEALMRAINELQGTMTIIAIAHRLTTIRNADRVVRLKDGKVDRIGSYEEVVA